LGANARTSSHRARTLLLNAPIVAVPSIDSDRLSPTQGGGAARVASGRLCGVQSLHLRNSSNDRGCDTPVDRCSSFNLQPKFENEACVKRQAVSIHEREADGVQ
jgi:hypothetical protein